MSRLFAVVRTIDEIAAHFDINDPPAINVPIETIEGMQGLIVLEKDGRRLLKSVPWGFPRHTKEMRSHNEPPGRIGLVADLTNPMWEHLVVEPRYRCLIPITHFANPEGVPGHKTRAWFSVRDETMVAWAGFCRNTPEFGPVFAGMTMSANELVKPFNDRMPVLLRKIEWDRWLRGTIQDVIAFQFRDPMPSEMLEILHSGDRWQSGIPPRDPSSPRRRTVSML